jgi:hypothetical protein
VRFHLEHRILEKLGLREEPYLAFIFKEADDPTSDIQKFLAPLLAACLLSEHIQLIFPVIESVSRLIDEAFDELFKSHSQLFKDFVPKSKGIIYAKDLTPEEKSEVLKYAAFVITTDKRISKVALSKKLPFAYSSQSENIDPEIIVLNYEEIKDGCLDHGLMEALKAMLQ